jgi:hypothetical protein
MRRDQPEPDKTQLAWFDLNSRQVRALATIPQLLYKSGLSLAPDGRTLLYTKIEKSESDLILVDNFPGNGSRR